MQPTPASVELLLPHTVRLGDTVPITLQVRNEGKQPIQLELPGRPVAFDVIVQGPGGTEVWRRLRGVVTPSILMLLRLEPGEAREFTTRWPQVDHGRRPVAPGSYQVWAVLPIGPERLTTRREELVITP